MSREPARGLVHDVEGEPTASCRVELVGRLGARVDRRDLPSGDEVTTFTIVVDRPASSRSRAGTATVRVDSIPCQSFRATVSRRAEALTAGTWVRAEGVLRRRFWRSGPGLGSALEVEVTRLERMAVRR